MELMTEVSGQSKRRVCYFFDGEIGNYHYAQQHPMKPHRIKMTHSLVMNYGLYKRMEIFRAKPATRKEMAQFHTDEYVEFLNRITPDNMDQYGREQAKFNVGDDCPVFDGLFEYCSISAGGSMEGAARLSRDKCDIAVNWAGGLHHAKKSEASGFCYINDIVLGILELLRYHKRVLYIDIDVHHGDGVEEAFYTTDRVMTCSFHKYGEFFPGTGEFRDIGHGKGKYYSVNFPLRDGITDENYKSVFEPVIDKIMEWYQPSAVVLQCGADSLSGDRLGPLNLSMRGHANCVSYIRSFNLPLLLLGGGGYTIRNVSRTWAYETGVACGVELGDQIPINEYYEYFGPTYKLDVPPSNQEDMNTREYLEKIRAQLFENLRHTGFAPSVESQPIPKLDMDDKEEDEDLIDPDTRQTGEANGKFGQEEPDEPGTANWSYQNEPKSNVLTTKQPPSQGEALATLITAASTSAENSQTIISEAPSLPTPSSAPTSEAIVPPAEDPVPLTPVSEPEVSPQLPAVATESVPAASHTPLPTFQPEAVVLATSENDDQVMKPVVQSQAIAENADVIQTDKGTNQDMEVD